ncbi:hypothetical protein HK097_000556 [Rhizophlyctis rosea]|uniref:Uncharacterized protein n=1 Tax=Rhizophlyctis rosea TaxID=64517 RepID=A0AAD5XA52_9FUNG|nr:hypothetical protein HK097_000556 [Rhizophlyctis rosea]
MASQNEKSLEDFQALTGCSQDQAHFWLDANNWDLQNASAGYFQSLDDATAAPSVAGGANSEPAASGPFSGAGPFAGGGPYQGSSSSQSKSKKSGGTSSSSSQIKSLRDLHSGEEDESSDEDDGHQNFFAGGEKSGVMMQGGPKKPNGPQDLIKDIIQKAANAGPAPDDFQKSNKPKFFGGSGYRLGSEDEPEAGPSAPAVQPTPGPPTTEPVERHLTFWRNGFSIEDGPLRPYDAPESQEFLRAINSGRAPTALLNVAYDQPVEVKVAHKLQEDYTPPPKKPAAPFSGSGQRLGAVTPDSAPASQAPATAPAPTNAPTGAFSVDESQPTTSIQIRLADGTRLVAKFNHTHTVADLRRFINASRSGEAARNYVLQTTFPVKVLTDDAASIKDAGLLNAVVAQRYA